MDIGKEITAMLEEAKHLPVPVKEEANLCADLGFDSLAFIDFLLRIEEEYAITFDIMEMEVCLQVGRLTELVEKKARERNYE